MTGPDDSQAATRPISVAELLAKNGTIGSPPVGGRRRRRRGNSDAVTVAELTGEIPVVRVDDSGAMPVVVDDVEDTAAQPGREPQPEPEPEAAPEPAAEATTNGQAVAEDHGARAYEASRLERAPEPTPRRGRDAAPQRSSYPRPVRAVAEPAEPEVPEEPAEPSAEPPASDAEAMSPDPIEDVDVEVTDGVAADELGLGDAGAVVGESLLFGGESLADELARGGGADIEPIAGDLSDDLVDDDPDAAEDLEAVDLSEAFDEDYDEYEDFEEPTRGQLIVRGLLVALQSVLAVAFGAALFLAFDRLWLWNSLVAMVLAILATLGLVAGVWVVRKTEDIASTLIAVGVGLLVTFGPLALMHAT